MAREQQVDAGRDPDEESADRGHDGGDRRGDAEERRLRHAGHPVADRGQRTLDEPGDHRAEERRAPGPAKGSQQGPRVLGPEREERLELPDGQAPVKERGVHGEEGEEGAEKRAGRRREAGGGERGRLGRDVGRGVAKPVGEIRRRESQLAEPLGRPLHPRLESAARAEGRGQGARERTPPRDEQRDESRDGTEDAESGDRDGDDRGQTPAAGPETERIEEGL